MVSISTSHFIVPLFFGSRGRGLQGLPYSEAGRASLSRLEGQGLQGTLSAMAICMKRIL